MPIEEVSNGTDAGDHVKKYAETYLNNRKINGSIIFCAVCIGAIVTLVLGLINGLAISPTVLAFGVFGGLTIFYLFLNLFIILIYHFYQSHDRDRREGAYIRFDVPGQSGRNAGPVCPERFEFGRNLLDEYATNYLKGIRRREMKRTAIIVCCVNLAPIICFSFGLVSIYFAWEAAITAFVKIAYPICIFAGWVTVHVRRVYHMGIGFEEFHGGIVAYILEVFADGKRLKAQGGIDCIYLYIKWFSCPKCHMVNSYEIANIDYGDTYNYDRVTKSKFGSQTVGTVYLDGKKIGDIEKTYATETHETGSERTNHVLFRCKNCGNEMKGTQYESWGKSNYTR